MASHPIPSPDEDIPSSAGAVSMRGPAPTPGEASLLRGTTGDVSGTRAGTATGRAVRQLLQPGAGAFSTKSFLAGKDKDIQRTRTIASPTEAARAQSVRSLRAGGPRGTGPGGIGTDPRTLLTGALGATPTSGRTRGAVPTGGTAGGGATRGTPTFAAQGNFRSGVLNTGLFLDTTGLSAIDKLNPRA